VRGWIGSAYLGIFRRQTGDFSRYYEQVPAETTFDELGVEHVPAADFPLGLDLHS